MKADNVTDLELKRHAKAMLELYPASNRVYYTYDPKRMLPPRPEDGKVKPEKYDEVFGSVSAEAWERHLTGEQALVIALACVDGTTKVTVLDVDLYGGVNFIETLQEIKDTGFPIYLHQSKSKGAHLTVFHDEPISIAKSVKVAHGIARLFKLENTKTKAEYEWFPPEQDAMPLPKVVNMPFFGGANGCGAIMQPGSKVGGAMLLDQFVRKITYLSAEQRAAIINTKEKPKEALPTTDDKGQQYATAKLRRYINELRSAVKGGRNNLLTKHAYHLGMMVARGWLQRDVVEREISAAIVSWGETSRHQKSLTSALDDSENKPHEDLAEDEVLTEDGVALVFADRHAGDLRYDVDVGRWFQWSGSHWQRTNKPVAFTYARDLAREMSVGQPQRVVNITSRANFAGNVERFARGDWALVIEQSAWDTDLYALGTPGGVVDLRTGALRDAQPEDLITKMTAVAPADTPDCPLWLKFLDETTEGNQDLVDFLQVLCGYSLTGDISEHLLVFIHGDGGNGKSVFVGAIAGLLGDYAIESAPEMFVDARFDRHPTELADLRGPRFVTSSETTGGRSWNETLVKKLTGGDKIKGRFMRQDFFEFMPQFQLVIVGNEAPNLKSVGEAMRRRLVMVPFDNQPKIKDTKLPEKLRSEWPGILRWLINGCLRWQAEGVRLPNVVKADTDNYFEEQDVFHQFVQFHLVKNQTARMADTEIFSLWEHYATQAGADVRDKRWVNGKLRGRPYNLEDKKSNGERYFLGIKRREVRPESAQGDLYASPDKPGQAI